MLAVIIEAVGKIGSQTDATGKVVNPEGWALNVPSFNGKTFGAPDFKLIGHFSLGGGFSAVGIVSGIVIVFSLVLSDFFDVMGTTIGLAQEADLLDADGQLPGIQQVLLIDGLAAVAGGAAGASSATTYVESASGIGDGARTGLASVVTGLLFLVTVFLSPLAQFVPSEAAAPALVVVGVLMMRQVRNIDFQCAGAGGAGVPDHRADAVHLLDHQRGRGRLHQLRGAAGGGRQGPARCTR